MRNTLTDPRVPLRAACLLPLLLLAAQLLAGCGPSNVGGQPQTPKVFNYSFEGGLSGFTADGTDLLVDDAEVDWHIEASEERASAGSSSAELFVENFTDAAKIWLEQPLDLDPSSSYELEIEFDFATDDFGDINLWTIIAGALNEDPETAEDLEGIYRGDTGNGTDDQDEYLWLPKSYTQTITTNAAGEAWLVLGVWGTWETQNTYYIDKVKVTATKQ